MKLPTCYGCDSPSWGSLLLLCHPARRNSMPRMQAVGEEVVHMFESLSSRQICLPRYRPEVTHLSLKEVRWKVLVMSLLVVILIFPLLPVGVGWMVGDGRLPPSPPQDTEPTRQAVPMYQYLISLSRRVHLRRGCTSYPRRRPPMTSVSSTNTSLATRVIPAWMTTAISVAESPPICDPAPGVSVAPVDRLESTQKP